jgi:predicted GTPase
VLDSDHHANRSVDERRPRRPAAADAGSTFVHRCPAAFGRHQFAGAQFCSRVDAVPQSNLRYLVNSLREFFELPGTPVRISLREKANPFAHKRKRPS